MLMHVETLFLTTINSVNAVFSLQIWSILKITRILFLAFKLKNIIYTQIK